MSENTDYCLQLLREGDFDRYIAVLFAPPEKRASLAALYAFNLEIARIGDAIKEPLAGEIRLQWWCDAIKDEGAESQQNPVLAALLAAIEAHDLPKPALIRACEARIFDVYNDVFETRTDLEGYCGETASTLMQLACRILDREASEQSADACGHAGVAQAVAGFIRMLPITTVHKQLYISFDILSALGVSRDDLMGDERNVEAELRVSTAMIALARQHYCAFRQAFRALPSSLRPAFLPVAPLNAYLKVAEKKGAGVFRDVATLSRLRRQWLMMRVGMTGRFPA